MSVAKLSLIHLRRKPYQNLAILLSLFFVYTLTIIFVLVLFGSDSLLKHFASQPQITAFLKNQADDNAVNQLIMKLQKTGKVKVIRYISQEKALELYQQVSKNPLLLDVIDSSVLPASLEISTYQPDDLEEVYKQLETSNLVDDIIYQRDLVKTISRWVKNIKLIGLVLISLFLLQALTVIWVVTGFKISGFRESIAIMKLLGASNTYVSFIFGLESFVIGLLAGLISTAVVGLLLYRSQTMIINLVGNALGWQSLPYDVMLITAPVVVVGTGFFSALLTLIAARWFLRR